MKLILFILLLLFICEAKAWQPSSCPQEIIDFINKLSSNGEFQHGKEKFPATNFNDYLYEDNGNPGTCVYSEFKQDHLPHNHVWFHDNKSNIIIERWEKDKPMKYYGPFDLPYNQSLKHGTAQSAAP